MKEHQANNECDYYSCMADKEWPVLGLLVCVNCPLFVNVDDMEEEQE